MIIKGDLITLHSLHTMTAMHYSLLEFIAMQATVCYDFSDSLYHSSFSLAISRMFLLFARAHVSI